ncbi:MAG: DUF2185 domain-containing protein [Treponema sp.]|jgi:hypothetical protein|nr:DUF2185 domain-containing protein [Treponema sp.]
MKSWELENIFETSITYKHSFFMPNEMERNNQKINAEVRLHFILKNPIQHEPRAERMWVRITEVSKKNSITYKGILLNEPIFIKDLKVNDIIEFSADNIAQIIIKNDDPRWLDAYEQFTLVSKMYFENKGIINFLYREEPDNKDDSGWRMFTGLENDDYANDPQNIKMIKVAYLLDHDPSLLEPLKNGYNIAYERDNEKSKWKKVEDWMPE